MKGKLTPQIIDRWFRELESHHLKSIQIDTKKKTITLTWNKKWEKMKFYAES